MKTCSSWNWKTLDYTYWNCPGEQSPGGWGPPQPSSAAAPGAGIGRSFEEALPGLPVGCKVIGRGPDARGQIVRPVASGGLGLVDLSPGSLARDFLVGVVSSTVAVLVASYVFRRK